MKRQYHWLWSDSQIGGWCMAEDINDAYQYFTNNSKSYFREDIVVTSTGERFRYDYTLCKMVPRNAS